MAHAETPHHRPARPTSRAGAAGFGLAVLGVALLLPALMTNPDASSGLVTAGWACLMAGAASALYAVTVEKDRSWLTFAGLSGVLFGATPLGALVLVVAGIVLGMNLIRVRSGAGAPAPASGERSPAPLAERLGRGGAVVATVAAHVVAGAAILVLAFLSGSGLLDLATLAGATAGFVCVWWLRPTHPYLAVLLSWLVVAAIFGVLVLADALGLLGA